MTSPATHALAHWSALPLRLIVGYGFAAHGYAKLARGPDAFIDILHATRTRIMKQIPVKDVRFKLAFQNGKAAIRYMTVT